MSTSVDTLLRRQGRECALASAAADGPLCTLDRAQDLGCGLQERRSPCRGLDRPLSAYEQLDPELALDSGDLAADGRLRQVELLRREREAAASRHLQGCAYVLGVHVLRSLRLFLLTRRKAAPARLASRGIRRPAAVALEGGARWQALGSSRGW